MAIKVRLNKVDWTTSGSLNLAPHHPTAFLALSELKSEAIVHRHHPRLKKPRCPKASTIETPRHDVELPLTSTQ
jgi:hypothetical protein